MAPASRSAHRSATRRLPPAEPPCAQISIDPRSLTSRPQRRPPRTPIRQTLAGFPAGNLRGSRRPPPRVPKHRAYCVSPPGAPRRRPNPPPPQPTPPRPSRRPSSRPLPLSSSPVARRPSTRPPPASPPARLTASTRSPLRSALRTWEVCARVIHSTYAAFLALPVNYSSGATRAERPGSPDEASRSSHRWWSACSNAAIAASAPGQSSQRSITAAGTMRIRY